MNAGFRTSCQFRLVSIHKRHLLAPGGVLARFQSSKLLAMPAVENSLGPCRKPKSTIYGWTLINTSKKRATTISVKKRQAWDVRQI